MDRYPHLSCEILIPSERHVCISSLGFILLFLIRLYIWNMDRCRSIFVESRYRNSIERGICNLLFTTYLHHYLSRSRFVIRTDHLSLGYLKSIKNRNGLLHKIAKIKYLPGKCPLTIWQHGGTIGW